MRIVIVSGSMRHESVTNRVALCLHNQLTQLKLHSDIIDVREINLPFITDGFANKEAVPDEHKQWANLMFEADAVIMLTPEYNGSYTPSLKNVFDHFPKQSRKSIWYSNSIARRIRWYTRSNANATIGTGIVWNFISLHVGDSWSG